jgi:hypothetical protein
MRRLREDLLREQSASNSVDFFQQFTMLKESDVQPNSWSEVRLTGTQNPADALKSTGPITTTIPIVAGDEGSITFLSKSCIDIDMDLTINYNITYNSALAPAVATQIFVCPKSAASLICDIQLKVGNNALYTVPYNRIHQ